MKSNLKWFIVIMLIPVVILTSCSQKINYETDGAFMVVTWSPAGPDEYRNLFPRNYSVYDNGKLTLNTEATDDIKIGDDAPVHEIELKKEEIEDIQQLIEENNFWGFQEDISDDDSVDGAFYYITVNLMEESKTVGGLNPNDADFMEIADYVFGLVEGEDYRLWEEEMTDYILEKNPL